MPSEAEAGEVPAVETEGPREAHCCLVARASFDHVDRVPPSVRAPISPSPDCLDYWPGSGRMCWCCPATGRRAFAGLDGGLEESTPRSVSRTCSLVELIGICGTAMRLIG